MDSLIIFRGKVGVFVIVYKLFGILTFLFSVILKYKLLIDGNVFRVFLKLQSEICLAQTLFKYNDIAHMTFCSLC
jgi:hypothetical protein